MNVDYKTLEWGHLIWAVSLISVNAAISIGLQLRLHRSLLIASVRTIVQLSAVGLLLDFVFSAGGWSWVLALVLGMSMVAGATAAGRTEFRYRGMYLDTMVAVLFSALTPLLVSTLVIFRPDPWYSPYVVIPVTGMILGNMLTGVSLALDAFNKLLVEQRQQIEGRLHLGATAWEAARPAFQYALRVGMMPIINSMMVVGLVSLPGMMTGQILGGVSPMEAVKYQIAIMFIIAASTGMGSIFSVALSFRRLFSPRHQLLVDKLRRMSRG